MSYYRARSLMRSAERRTGLKRWGDEEFVPRMDRWLTAVDNDRPLTELGRSSVLTLALLYAANRLKLEALIAAHPEIEEVEIPRPIVVSGLPRSGTTSLATLIAGHPDLRSLRFWEAIDPFTGDIAALRRQRAARWRDASVTLMPKLRQFHDFKPDDFTDDQELQGLAFGSYMLEWQGHMPSWRDLYLSEDQEPVYRYLKRAMQALSFLRGPSRWIIKSPQHVEQLPALKAVFPDALLVVTRRSRGDVDRSMGRMIEYIGRYTRTTPVPRRYWPDRFDQMEASYAAWRDLFPDRIELRLKEWSQDEASVCAIVDEAANLQTRPA